mmetsp:Transcript_10359/g.16749  ORF Transcript_10359/g.16749 Transcript_10359/m.16749 type:complete len:208 (+) Transcript_10359:3-626(+)
MLRRVGGSRWVLLISILLVIVYCHSSSSALRFEEKESTMSKKRSAETKSEVEIQTGTPGWLQKTITVTAPSRGCHLITRDIMNQLPELRNFKVGVAHLFIKHTSASLTINENADPDVQSDMEKALNRLVPESWNQEMFAHTAEGPDDMPGHVKSTLVGASVHVPVAGGAFALGTWQGIYLCEHRDVGGWGSGHARKIVITVQGLIDN